MEDETRPLLAVVGPTATGKTALAVQLARVLGGEVVNADSRQVYRGMDIGTEKPTQEERTQTRHWLIDVADPDESFSLGRYLDLAASALDECWSRAALPLLVGGTGQYVWAVLEGWRVPRVPPDRDLRAELDAVAREHGPETLARELAAVDPESASRIDPRNVRRVVRALEVYRLTGRPLSFWRTRQPPEFEAAIVGLTCPRDELFRRIDARVDAMVEAGLVDEVRSLIERGFGCDLSAMSGIGYRQVCQYLEGEFSLEEAIRRVKTATHRLARTQRNWFRSDDARIHWVDVASQDALAEALRVVESKLTRKES